LRLRLTKGGFSNNNLVKSVDFRGESTYQYTINAISGQQQLNLKDDDDNLFFNLTIDGNTMAWSFEESSDNNVDYSKVMAVYHFKRL
jgi:hypothetical protein